MSSPFPPFPWKTLDAPLREPERDSLVTTLRALLRFQRTLGRWPALGGAPDATPFVSLYAGGSLRGCYGSHEGGPAERLARAFLKAQGDDRFGGLAPAERVVLAAQVSYPRGARLVNPATIDDEIEPGTHGVALVRDGAPPVLLLPHVARDEGLGAAGLLQALSRKARLADGELGSGALYLFETDDVVARQGSARAQRADTTRRKPSRPPGSPRSSARTDTSPSPSIRALPRRGSRPGPCTTGAPQWWCRPSRLRVGAPRRWRARDGGSRTTFAGRSPARRSRGWPDEPAAIAGTLALAVLAGVPVDDELAAFAESTAADPIARTPWHAAQVVAALEARAPTALWTACVADLDGRPWAPLDT